MSGRRILIGIVVAGAIFVSIILRNSRVDDATPPMAHGSASTSTPAQLPGRANSVAVSGAELLDEAIKAIEAETDDLKRNEAIESLVAQINEKDIASTLALLGNEDSVVRRELRNRLVRRWAELDIKAASAWVTQLAPGVSRQDSLNNLATRWAHQNFTEAVAWARGLPEFERVNAFLKIAYEAVEKDPKNALELARELPATEERDELVALSAGTWAENDARVAAEWAAQIPDRDLREQTLGRIAMTWSEKDPKSAAELALGQITPGRAQNDAVVSIVQQWSQTDPAKAAAWIAQFPEGPLRNTAAEEMIKQWADLNASEASEWLKTFPASRSRDRAIGAFVGKIAGDNPRLAATWAGQISEEYQRTIELERVAEAWMLSDPAGAKAWLPKSGLSESAQKRALGEQ